MRRAHAQRFCDWCAVRGAIANWSTRSCAVGTAWESHASHPAGTFWAAGPRRARREMLAARTTLVIPPTFFARLLAWRIFSCTGLRAMLNFDMIGWSIRRSRHAAVRRSARSRSGLRRQLHRGRIIMLHEGHRKSPGGLTTRRSSLPRSQKLREGDWQAVIPPRSTWLSRGRPFPSPSAFDERKSVAIERCSSPQRAHDRAQNATRRKVTGDFVRRW